MHHVAEQVLTGQAMAAQEFLGEMIEGYAYDEDMQFQSQAFIDFVLLQPRDMGMYETRVFATDEVYGTADVILVNGSHMHVIDLKTGFRYVEAAHNSQLMIYALGALNSMDILGIDVETISLTIFQPPVSMEGETWTVKRKVLDDFAVELRTAITNTVELAGEYLPSESACKYCPAASVCPALQDAATMAAAYDFAEVDDGLSEQKTLAEWHALIPSLEIFVKSVKEAVRADLLAGRTVEGFRLAQGSASRSWKSEKDLFKILRKGKLPKKIAYQPAQVSSPAQMEKTLKLLGSVLDISDAIVKKYGDPSVVPTSSKKKEYVPESSAADDFSDVQT